MPILKKKNRKELLAQISTHCAECGVRACSIFNDCDPETLDKVSYAKKSFVYLKGQRILIEGMDEKGIYFIHSGKVKIYKTGKNGRQLIIHLAKSGEAIGFRDADKASGQPVSAMALEDTRVCHMDRAVFLNIMRDSPEIAIKVLKHFKDLLTESEEQTLKMARLNVPAKVADALYTIYLAYGANETDQSLNLRLSRQEIADLAGSTKEQISKTLSDLRMQGIIRTKGKQIMVLDLKALQALSEG